MDPYNDEDSSQEGNDMNMLGGGEPSPTFMRGLNVLGSTIRDGGFCSPKAKKKAADADADAGTLTAPSTEETTRTPKRVSESEDSDSVQIRSVTFVDDVEPLIVQDDLVIEEDKCEEPEPDANEEAAEVVVEEQTKTETDEKKEQTESAVAVASRKSIIPTNVIALLSVVSLAIAYFYPGSLSPIIEHIHLAKEKIPMGTGTAIVFAFTVSAAISSSAQIALATELIWAALVSMMVSAGAYHVIFS